MNMPPMPPAVAPRPTTEPDTFCGKQVGGVGEQVCRPGLVRGRRERDERHAAPKNCPRSTRRMDPGMKTAAISMVVMRALPTRQPASSSVPENQPPSTEPTLAPV